jgi:hypothetical protein
VPHHHVPPLLPAPFGLVLQGQAPAFTDSLGHLHPPFVAFLNFGGFPQLVFFRVISTEKGVTCAPPGLLDVGRIGFRGLTWHAVCCHVTSEVSHRDRCCLADSGLWELARSFVCRCTPSSVLESGVCKATVCMVW